ncbi:putative Histidine kinase [Candidatus Terasakiella magnetica]|uniref:histidine kinase n=1 Tax=Candidatus Terasakiella magnetica TaxID=1867952 RepID=A0A1C3RHX0_9PROT|nr:ATP-binding protein [Candidatus Terasakiella magnetica]SCA56876.1 putative Histidine kinase [Candidatus Terasakiella magnetica]
MKLTQKLTILFLGGYLLLGLAIYLGSEVLKGNLETIIHNGNPKIKNALEMEINIEEASANLHYYLITASPKSLASFKKHIIGFEDYFKSYSDLPTGPEEQEVLKDIRINFDKFSRVSDILTKKNAQQLAKITERRRILSNELEILLDDILQKGKDLSHYSLKDHFLVEMEVSIHELISAVRGYLLRHDLHLKEQVNQSIKDFEKWKKQLTSLSLTSNIRRKVEVVNFLFNEIKTLSLDILILEDEKDRLLTTLNKTTTYMETIVNDHLRSHATQQAKQAEEEALSTITNIRNSIIFFLIFGIILISVISRPLHKAIRELISATHKVKEGDEAQIVVERNDELGELAHAFNHMSREITEQKHKLVQARDDAETANKTKSEFLAAMSHEIRTPLTGVMGFADLLLVDDIPQESKQKAMRIKGSTEALYRIINDILDMSKLEAGKFNLEMNDFDLQKLVKEVTDLFEKSRRTDKNVVWELHFSDDFPQGIHSDITRIRQILMNLLGNAFKFTQEGTISIHCEMTEDDEGQPFVKFSVIDTGIGIADDTINMLFTSFTQADASISRKFEGTGLGLAICKSLIDLLGGEIGVESQEGKGSTFWFTLPYKEATDIQSQDEPKALATDYKALRPLNILVAEDNRVNQHIIQKFMEAYGHKITIAANGLEALNAHKENPYELILMDVRMPEMDGPEATRNIRQLSGEPANVPIIAITADAIKQHIEGYFEAGMNAFVPKPFNWVQTILAINNVMDEDIHVLKDD